MIVTAHSGNKKGFTLVELIVVIAIIGVLAAILIPSMMDYVKKSRLRTANSNAKLAYTAACTYITEQETMGNDVTNLFYGSSRKFNAGIITVRASGLNEGDQAVANSLLENGREAGFFNINYTTICTGKRSVVAHWAKSQTDEMIGQYPDPITWDKWEAHHDSAYWSVAMTYLSPS